MKKKILICLLLVPIVLFSAYLTYCHFYRKTHTSLIKFHYENNITYYEYNGKKYYSLNNHPRNHNNTRLQDFDWRYRDYYYDFVELSTVAQYDGKKNFIPNNTLDSFYISKYDNPNNPVLMYHKSDIRSEPLYSEDFDFEFNEISDDNILQIVITGMDDGDYKWSTDNPEEIFSFLQALENKEAIERWLQNVTDLPSYRVNKKYSGSPVMLEVGTYFSNEFHYNEEGSLSELVSEKIQENDQEGS